MLSWNNDNTFQFSDPLITQTIQERGLLEKIRARWLNKSRYNPMKAERPNTPEMMMTNLDTIGTDKKVPLPVKVFNRFGPFYSFCKQGAPHPYPKESDWSVEDWDGT